MNTLLVMTTLLLGQGLWGTDDSQWDLMLSASLVQEPTKFPNYNEALATKKLPFVVFVGINPRAIDGVTVATAKSLYHENAWQENAIAVIRADGYVWLPKDSSDADIRRNLTARTVGTSPSFFMPEVNRPIADDSPDVGSLPKWPKILEGMTQYSPTKFTQSIYNQGEETDQVSRTVTAAKWHQSGGMLGVKGFKSTLYHFKPEPPREWVGRIPVFNGSNDQDETGIKRSYADGTRFIDRLSNEDGGDFEARLRFKKNGKWQAKVIFSDPGKRPAGYVGLNQSCASCHDEAGTGIYGEGLVPGGDTVISDELNWGLIHALSQSQRKGFRHRD